MQFHFHANQSHFDKNGFALRLVLKQRHKRTRKWPICAITTQKTLRVCFVSLVSFDRQKNLFLVDQKAVLRVFKVKTSG